MENENNKMKQTDKEYTTKCGLKLTDEQQFELIKEGFLIEDYNKPGFDTFNKLNYVYPDKIYAKHFDKTTWRIVYIGQPSLIRHYVGQSTTCGAAYGYPIDQDGGELKHVKLASLKFLDNFKP